MTSRDHRFAAARCWERAGFYLEAADRFTQAAAWRDAGRCLSQAERHQDAAVAYSRAGEPLLEAREQLMAGWPERALPLYQRLRSAKFATPREQVEVLLSLGDLEAAKRVALGSGDRQAVALFARLTSTRARPDLAIGLGLELAEPGWESLLPWNRSLCRQLPLEVDEPANAWPTTTFSAVALVPIWQEQTGGGMWGDRVLAWSADNQFFAAALNTQGLARGRIGPEGIRLERWQLPDRTFCTRFLPASHAILAGHAGGEISLVEENGDVMPVPGLRLGGYVYSITFAPEGDRVAVAAKTDPGALLKVSSWQAGQTGIQLAEIREPGNDCFPLTAWTPDGRLCRSPGPGYQPNRLGFLGQPAFEAHADELTSLAFTADGRFLITASFDQTVVVRDGETGQSLAPLERFANWVYGATVHPQAALVAVGEGDRLHLLRLHPGEPPRLSRLSEQTMDDGVQSLAFSPNGQHLLVMTWNHLHLFRVELEP